MRMTTAMACRWGAAFAAAATLGGCTGAGLGELGEGEFVYQCVGSADIACDDGEADFPRAIAVGGKFDMRFEIYDFDEATPIVSSAVPVAVREESSAFRVVRPGYALMLAVNGEGAVIDMKHLLARAPDSLEVYRKDSAISTTLEVELGEEFSLRTEPFAAEEALAGTLEYIWSAADDGALSISSTEARSDQATVRALRAGDTSLTVSGGGATRQVDVHVVDGSDSLDAGPDAGGPEPDAGGSDPDAGELGSDAGGSGMDAGAEDGGV